MNTESINHIVTHPLFGILCGLAGFFFGNRLAYWRDWRNDFNEIADAMFMILSEERNHPSAYRAGLLDSDFAYFRRRLRWYNLRGFDAALRGYREAQKRGEYRDTMNGVYYNNHNEIASAVEKLLKYTNRK